MLSRRCLSRRPACPPTRHSASATLKPTNACWRKFLWLYDICIFLSSVLLFLSFLFLWSSLCITSSTLPFLSLLKVSDINALFPSVPFSPPAPSFSRRRSLYTLSDGCLVFSTGYLVQSTSCLFRLTGTE